VILTNVWIRLFSLTSNQLSTAIQEDFTFPVQIFAVLACWAGTYNFHVLTVDSITVLLRHTNAGKVRNVQIAVLVMWLLLIFFITWYTLF